MKSVKNNQLNIKLILWIEHHIESLSASFKRNISNPLSFSFTVAMIAIALSIPLSMYILFSSAQQLTQQWDRDKQITLFLEDNITLIQAESLAKQILKIKLVTNAYVIDKQQALDEFKQQMGLESLSADLPKNPIPHLIIVEPDTSILDIKDLQALEDELINLEQVQLVQFDLLWVQKITTMIDLINRIQWIVSLILLFAITLIIINVIRWEVSSRHSEIEIIKLVGASDSYVRRPFLYSGLWLGLAGSVLAIFIVTMGSWLIQPKTKHLASLFGSDFEINTLSINACLLIVLLLCFLGIAGSWIAVSQKLKKYT